MTAQAFVSYRSLQEIYLNGNQISDINRKAFAGLLNLQHLDLSGNKLAKVPSKALTDIPYLRVLILRNNPLVSIDGSVFWATEYVEKLDLENCKLEHLSPKSFEGLRNLKELNLINNKISTLDAAMQQNMPSALRVLRIHGNPWNCDCRIRWLKVWLTEKKINWKFGTNTPICSDPASLEDLRLENVIPSEFACAPQIKRPNRTNLNVENYAKVTVQCHIFADPIADVFWYHNKKMIDSKQRNKYNITKSGSENSVSTLSIRNFETTDIGKYQCHANNKAGSARQSFSIKIFIPPISTTLVPRRTTTVTTDTALGYASIIAISAGAFLFLLLLMCFICYGLKRRDRRNTYKVRDYKKPQKGKKKKRKDHELVFEGKSDDCDVKNDTLKGNNRSGADKLTESRTIKVGNGHATTVIDADSSTETEPLNPIPPIPPPPKPMRLHQGTREPTPDLLRGDHNDSDKEIGSPYPCGSQHYFDDPYATYSGKTKSEKSASKLDRQCTSPTISHPNVSYRKLPNNIPAPPASARPYLSGNGRGTNSPVNVHSVNGGRGTPTQSGRNTPTGYSSPVHHTSVGFKGHNGSRLSPTSALTQKENNLNNHNNKDKNTKNCNIRGKKSPSPENVPSIYTEDEPAPVKIITDKTKTDNNKINNKKQHPLKPGEKDDFGTAV